MARTNGLRKSGNELTGKKTPERTSIGKFTRLMKAVPLSSVLAMAATKKPIAMKGECYLLACSTVITTFP